MVSDQVEGDMMRLGKQRAISKEGYRWVVDIDLEKFFDKVNHDKLMGILAKTIKDRILLKLIRRYLQSGVMINGVVMETDMGTPQGGPLSPLLSNIMLHELDKELRNVDISLFGMRMTVTSM